MPRPLPVRWWLGRFAFTSTTACFLARSIPPRVRVATRWPRVYQRSRRHSCMPNGYHKVTRPKSGRTDEFDLVTKDADGKVLHVAQWMARCTGEQVRQFVELVRGAKSARNRSGDLGGAFVVAPLVWCGGVHHRLPGLCPDGRPGGFHLMLSEEKDAGFEPIVLPGQSRHSQPAERPREKRRPSGVDLDRKLRSRRYSVRSQAFKRAFPSLLEQKCSWSRLIAFIATSSFRITATLACILVLPCSRSRS